MRQPDVISTSNTELEQGFHLAYWLHPDTLVAASVTANACILRATRLKHESKRDRERQRLRDKRSQEKQNDASGQKRSTQAWQALEPRKKFYRKRPIPDACRFQYCIYVASELQERLQDEDAQPEPAYYPTADDYVVRYVKSIVQETMDRPPQYALGGLGCLLHTYPPQAMSDVAAATEFVTKEALNMVKVAKELSTSETIKRFDDLSERLSPGAAGLEQRVRTPEAREIALIEASLRTYVPWGGPHIPPPSLDVEPSVARPQSTSWIERWTDWCKQHVATDTRDRVDQLQLDWDCFCALVDPEWGLAELIRIYNQAYAEDNRMQLDDPHEKLGIPLFAEKSTPPDGDPPDAFGGGDRFQPPPPDVRLIKTLYAALVGRMAAHRMQRIYLQFDDAHQVSVAIDSKGSERFDVPVEVPYLTFYGEDANGTLPLGLVPVSDLVALSGTTVFSLQLVNGQYLRLRVQPQYAASGELQSFEMQFLPPRRRDVVTEWWRWWRWDKWPSWWRGRWQFTPTLARHWIGGVASLLLVIGAAAWWGLTDHTPLEPSGRSGGPAYLSDRGQSSAWPMYRFQQGLRNPASGAQWVLDAPRFTGRYGLGATAVPAMVFRLGVVYTETLSLLQADQAERAARHMQRLIEGLDAVGAPTILPAYVRTVQSTLQQPQYTHEMQAQLMAMFEPLYMETYTRSPQNQRRLLFRAGAWLKNIDLAVGSGDLQALGQDGILSDLHGDLTELGMAAESDSIRQEIRQLISQSSSVARQDIDRVREQIQKLQQLLSH